MSDSRCNQFPASELLKIIDEMYGEDPTLSMVHVAKVLGVGYTTVGQAIKDLGMKSYVRRVRALISAKAKLKRVERSIDLQEWLKENPDTGMIAH